MKIDLGYVRINNDTVVISENETYFKILEFVRKHGNTYLIVETKSGPTRIGISAVIFVSKEEFEASQIVDA